MKNEKYTLTLDEYELGVMINALNDMRNRLIEEDKSSDFVDDVLLKTANAQKKRFRLRENESYESRE